MSNCLRALAAVAALWSPGAWSDFPFPASVTLEVDDKTALAPLFERCLRRELRGTRDVVLRRANGDYTMDVVVEAAPSDQGDTYSVAIAVRSRSGDERLRAAPRPSANGVGT